LTARNSHPPNLPVTSDGEVNDDRSTEVVVVVAGLSSITFAEGRRLAGHSIHWRMSRVMYPKW
jgi:hypothetical protein